MTSLILLPIGLLLFVGIGLFTYALQGFCVTSPDLYPVVVGIRDREERLEKREEEKKKRWRDQDRKERREEELQMARIRKLLRSSRM